MVRFDNRQGSLAEISADLARVPVCISKIIQTYCGRNIENGL